MHALIIIILILAILLVIFTLQNAFGITISVFFWKIDDAPLVLVLLCCILLGYLLGAIYFYPRIFKLKKDYKKALKSEKKLENRLEAERIPENKAGPEGIELEIDDKATDKGFFRE
jgi:lipopolysaccharide assembly protein A